MKDYYELNTDNLTTPSTYTHKFYEVEDRLINYSSPIVLLGTTETGRTTVMRQLYKSHATRNSKYFIMSRTTDEDSLFTVIQECANTGCDLLCVDDVTDVPNLDTQLSRCIDYCISIESKMKIILSGKGTLLLLKALNVIDDSAVTVINFNPIKWLDYSTVLNTTFYDFILSKEGMFLKADYAFALARDIWDSISHLKDKSEVPNIKFTTSDVLYVISAIRDNMIMEIDNVPSQELLCYTDDNQVEVNDNFKCMIDKDLFIYIANVMYRIGLLSPVKVRAVNGEIKNTLYVNLPALLNKVSHRSECRYTVGHVEKQIYKLIAYTQIDVEIKDIKKDLHIFAFKDTVWNVYFDMVIRNDKTKHIFFIQFKNTSKKENRYLNDSRILKHFSRYECHFLNIYLQGSEQSPTKYNIGYFLEHLNDIPGLIS